jgi:F-type H+-transporting ATPase subunit b
LTAALANVVMAAPASAGGALFNFDLTFPIMLGQFLLLTVFLEKTWFTPVGKLLDQRDEDIRKKLESVQGDTQELARLQQEAEKVLREAREEANAAIEQANKEAKAEQDAKIEETKAVRH